MSEETPPQVEFQQVEAPEGLEELYTNGFKIALGNADLHVMFQRNGRPVQVVNMSFTLAKTLSQLLGNMVDHIETQGDFKIKTTRELDDALLGEARGKKE